MGIGSLCEVCDGDRLPPCEAGTKDEHQQLRPHIGSR